MKYLIFRIFLLAFLVANVIDRFGIVVNYYLRTESYRSIDVIYALLTFVPAIVYFLYLVLRTKKLLFVATVFYILLAVFVVIQSLKRPLISDNEYLVALAVYMLFAVPLVLDLYVKKMFDGLHKKST